TEDGHVIVTHDRQVLAHRCLDTAPAFTNDPEFPYVGKYVKDLSLAQIRTLDCGSQRAAAHPGQQTVPGERMVLLSDVFDLVKRYGADDVMLNIETKVEAGAPHETAPRELFVGAVVEQIQQHNMLHQVSIQSFDWGALMLVRELEPALPIVALSNAQSFLQCGMDGASPWTGGIDMDDFACNLPAAAASFGADAISPVHGHPQNGRVSDADYQPFTTQEMVEQAHSSGIKIIPWTVNDRETAASLLAMGVDGIITDYPDMLRNLLSDAGIEPPSPTSRPVVDVTEKSIRTLQQMLSSGETSSALLVQQYLDRINAYDDQGPQLNTLISLNSDALEQARQRDAERQQTGPRTLLHGIPIVIKDNYNTTDLPTSGASQSLADFVPDDEATQVKKLREAGAIILGKTNLHEFAYGITSISSLGGQTRNPYDTQRMPGGSSGGTAAAIAANFAAVGMGSDTCGSIRIPAAFNNLVGLRPSKGLSSIYGVMPLSHTQDVAGPLARSIEDLAIVLDLTIGYDPADPDTAIMQGVESPRFVDHLGSAAIAGLRIARLTNWMDAADPQVRDVIDAALEVLRQQGASIVELNIPDMATLLSQSGLIGHEFEHDLDAYLLEFGNDPALTLEAIVAGGQYHEAVAGLLARSAAAEQNAENYQAALAIRAQLQQTLEDIMTSQSLDAIAYPPIASLPALIGETQPGNNCSLSGNSGYPAVSLPVGFSAEGLPIGMELLGARMSDTRLLAIAYAIEQLQPQRRAPTSTPPL
ncbi:MAG: hypothetical protein KKD00_08895, partial [Gammaproteobacteria bacterium]|nr:hypothetical protein [Gammaproteobacteria bacterium]